MENYILPSTAVVTALAASVLLFRKNSGEEQDKKLSPGPPPTFLVGNTFQIPTIRPWIYFENLGKSYGSMVHLSLGGDGVLVLNDAKDADELLNRRSNNYSSRKPLVYAGRYRSKDKRLVLMRYGDEMRKQRAAFHTIMQTSVLSKYEPAQERESLRLLHNMLLNPSEAQWHGRVYTASLVYTLGYGKDLNDEGLKDLPALLHILEEFIRDGMPGAHLVDTFPALDFLPDFMSPWRNEARKKHEHEMELYGRLFHDVKEKSGESFAARLWEGRDKHMLDETSMIYLVGTALEAGTDATTVTIMWFIVAAILYPETLEKAQKEVDSAIGADGTTMPSFANMNDLPYCFALVKEVLRWHASAPIGVPHLSDQDDTYKGYFIRGKTMVIPNVYAMHRNEAEFPDANNFKPERYLKDLVHPLTPAGITEGHYSFGFGRRVCPGKLFAAQTVWIAIVRLIWAFNFTHDRDENGEIIPIDTKGSGTGVLSEPEPFAFKMSPRSSTHEETLRREWSDVQCQK